ncbi:MAG: hypothetical protein AAGF12_22990 [Myxococcota bacterium]
MTTRPSEIIDGKYLCFEEVHPEFYDGFVLAEPAQVERFRVKNGLPANLLSEFTSRESGDEVMKQGVMIWMGGIGPDYYDIVFSNAEHPPFLSREGHRIVLTAEGYVTNVVDGCLHLFSLRYLEDFGPAAIASIEKRAEDSNRPRYELTPGRYGLAIFGGFHGTHRTPVYEFHFQRDPEAEFSGEVNLAFGFESIG